MVLAQCTFSMEQMALAGLTHGVQSWRLFQMGGAAPVFRSSFTSGEEILPRQAAPRLATCPERCLGERTCGVSVHWDSGEAPGGVGRPRSRPQGHSPTYRALPESARWLLTRGRVEEAKQPIQRVASVNKRKLFPELLSQVLAVAGPALP